MNSGRFEKFLALLGKTHRGQSAPEPSGAFEQNVMRQIRQQAAEQEAAGWLTFQPLVLRFAAATSLVAVLMLGAAVQQGIIGPSVEVAELMLDVQEENGLALLDELERQDKECGLATLCIASGMGAATTIERV